LGPRQAGRTTLALQLAANRTLERSIWIWKIRTSGPAAHYFKSFEDRLIILDEVQRLPNMFKGIARRHRPTQPFRGSAGSSLTQ
jgi:predicted AAA+ superfamily ATPase